MGTLYGFITGMGVIYEFFTVIGADTFFWPGDPKFLSVALRVTAVWNEVENYSI